MLDLFSKIFRFGRVSNTQKAKKQNSSSNNEVKNIEPPSEKAEVESLTQQFFEPLEKAMASVEGNDTPKECYYLPLLPTVLEWLGYSISASASELHFGIYYNNCHCEVVAANTEVWFVPVGKLSGCKLEYKYTHSSMMKLCAEYL
ncbi:hypothetical protein [Parashewanella tropica]|uniref:hypothetical protein n=1 Tax=Parashewanella tropica TaxID=2547970 RepID=UPI001059DE18|nr:hypothetical protein [Parashewanella tropica]